MPEKILVVDDDPNALRLVSYTLQVEGYEVITAGSGGEAVAAVAGEQPSLVILDVMMPDMSGLEVCRRLRSSVRTARLPILMLSAKGKVGDRVTGLRVGADDYVPKPVDPAELAARVEALNLRSARKARGRRRARFLAFLGAKGGVGTSTVAVNVAVAAAQQGKSVVLVDLHPRLGTVSALLGLDPPCGLAELPGMEALTMSRRDIERRMVPHSPGLRVLSSNRVLPSEERGELSPPHAEAILNGLSVMADFVMFDLPVHLPLINQAVLDRCDSVTLVTESDPVALGCARRRLALLQKWGITDELVGVVVVNRSLSASTMTTGELEGFLGVTVAAVVPPAPEACFHALRQGVPLVLDQPDHLAARMLWEFAEKASDQPQE